MDKPKRHRDYVRLKVLVKTIDSRCILLSAPFWVGAFFFVLYLPPVIGFFACFASFAASYGTYRVALYFSNHARAEELYARVTSRMSGSDISAWNHWFQFDRTFDDRFWNESF